METDFGVRGCLGTGRQVPDGVSVDTVQIVRVAMALRRSKLATMEALPEVDSIADRIVVLRGQRVMIDADLAVLYGVETRRLNQQARRNRGRFPADFMFELSLDEWKGMRLQIATTLHRSKKRNVAPLAFTEHGCLMLANVLRSGRAVEVSVLIVRAFVPMRSALTANVELASRVDELAREVERQSGKLTAHDAAILKLLAEIRRLTQFPEPTRRGIGFTATWPRGK
jgi:hypothetical protein